MNPPEEPDLSPFPEEAHTEDHPVPMNDFVVGIRYSLPAMLAELKAERFTGSYSMEKLDQKEIGKLFKPQKRRRAKPSE